MLHERLHLLPALVAAQAAADPYFVFHNIVHHIDETLLWEAFQRLRKGKEKATGIDGEADDPVLMEK